MGLETGGEKGNEREAFDAGSFRSRYRYKNTQIMIMVTPQQIIWPHSKRQVNKERTRKTAFIYASVSARSLACFMDP